MTKLVALEPMELKTTMPKDVTTGGKRKTKGRKSMKKGMKKSMKKGMKKSMKKGMKMKRKTHKKKYLKKKKGGDEGDSLNSYNSDNSVNSDNSGHSDTTNPRISHHYERGTRKEQRKRAKERNKFNEMSFDDQEEYLEMMRGFKN